MKCTTCKHEHDGPHSTCDKCLDRRRKERERKKSLGLCDAVGCTSQHIKGQRKCQYHADYFRDKSRLSRKKQNVGSLPRVRNDPLQDYDAVL